MSTLELRFIRVCLMNHCFFDGWFFLARFSMSWRSRMVKPSVLSFSLFSILFAIIPRRFSFVFGICVVLAFSCESSFLVSLLVSSVHFVSMALII